MNYKYSATAPQFFWYQAGIVTYHYQLMWDGAVIYDQYSTNAYTSIGVGLYTYYKGSNVSGSFYNIGIDPIVLTIGSGADVVAGQAAELQRHLKIDAVGKDEAVGGTSATLLKNSRMIAGDYQFVDPTYYWWEALVGGIDTYLYINYNSVEIYAGDIYSVLISTGIAEVGGTKYYRGSLAKTVSATNKAYEVGLVPYNDQVAGTAASLYKHSMVGIGEGAVVVSGKDVYIEKNVRIMAVDSGAYLVSGTAVSPFFTSYPGHINKTITYTKYVEGDTSKQRVYRQMCRRVKALVKRIGNSI